MLSAIPTPIPENTNNKSEIIGYRLMIPHPNLDFCCFSSSSSSSCRSRSSWILSLPFCPINLFSLEVLPCIMVLLFCCIYFVLIQ